MTILDAITQVDDLKHNTYSQEHKIRWLSRADGMVKRHIIDTHEGGEDVTFTGYTPDTPLDTVLLVPEPYDELYLRWLEAQIDYQNGELDRYNAGILLFNAVFDGYKNAYNAYHMPKGQKFQYF